jgi:acetyltransferase
LSPGALEELKTQGIIPHPNGTPIDVRNDADPERFAAAFRTALMDTANDGVLAIFTPQAQSDPTKTAELVAKLTPGAPKPVLASWMGGQEVADGTALLNRNGIPTYPYPDTGAKMFCLMWRYSHNLDLLYETPSLSIDTDARAERKTAASLLAAGRKSKRTILTEAESKEILAAYNIPVVETTIAHSVDDALLAAQEIGYPVVLKVHSESISHKMRSGGVRLHLSNTHAVREAYRDISSSITREYGEGAFQGVTVQRMVYPAGFELLLGCSHDPKFGPVLLFGTGGSSSEIHRDVALGIPPLNATLARRLMERTRVYPAMKRGTIGQTANLVALEQILVRFSQLIVEQRAIKEIDINPFLVSGELLIALDARIMLHEQTVALSDLPRLPIRPYPSEYARPWRTKDRTRLMIRPIRPEDEPRIVEFHKTLSEESVYLRYFQNIKLGQRISHERLRRICFIDYDRETALVAEGLQSEAGQTDIVGVGRLSRLHGTDDGEYAILVSDRFQGRGLGTELLKRLVAIGRKERMERIVATILPENTGMLKISERLGFTIHPKDRDAVLVVLDL